MHVRKDDVVIVSPEQHRQRGKVLKVFPVTNRVIVEGVNIIKRHTRPSQRNLQRGCRSEGSIGQIVERDGEVPEMQHGHTGWAQACGRRDLGPKRNQ